MCIPTAAFLRLTVAALAAVLLAILTGCATDQPVIQPPLQPTVITKLQLVHPAAILLADCDVTSTPPDPDSFAGHQFDVTPVKGVDAKTQTIANQQAEIQRLRYQLGLVTDYASGLQTDFKNCNAHPKVLRDWFANEDKLYPSTSP